MKHKKKITEKDFHLLLSFLTENNEDTVSLVKDQLKTVLLDNPLYKQGISKISDLTIKSHAEMLLGEFWYEEVEPQFKELFKQGRHLDLEKAVTLLATIEYPELKLTDITKTLDTMAEDI